MSVGVSVAPSRRECLCREADPGIAVTVVLCYAVVCMIIDQRVMQDKAQCASVDCFAVSTAGSRIVVSLQTAKAVTRSRELHQFFMGPGAKHKQYLTEVCHRRARSTLNLLLPLSPLFVTAPILSAGPLIHFLMNAHRHGPLPTVNQYHNKELSRCLLARSPTHTLSFSAPQGTSVTSALSGCCCRAIMRTPSQAVEVSPYPESAEHCKGDSTGQDMLHWPSSALAARCLCCRSGGREVQVTSRTVVAW
ncbi:unnamed protein product [Pleuronectes platessa]|uniref:Uncharacterized protein n=1 Tax=Pleuronectes platessa TaxID=8262 RepID=A0A9N7YI37_PLEPL|nr:unnamed protein product [Pleuronectes platessa]